ncbi:hypothetical protein P9112_014029 [Eukaryota sp. TZLM1-RC]
MASEDEFDLFQKELSSEFPAVPMKKSEPPQKAEPSQSQPTTSKKSTKEQSARKTHEYSVEPLLQTSRKRFYRTIAGETWEDRELATWPENDFRIFVGNLSPDVTDNMLSGLFSRFDSFHKARVVKGKGYGFVSLLNVDDYLRAMKELKGTYLGLKPIILKRSDWQKRNTTRREAKDVKTENQIHLKRKRK